MGSCSYRGKSFLGREQSMQRCCVACMRMTLEDLKKPVCLTMAQRGRKGNARAEGKGGSGRRGPSDFGCAPGRMGTKGATSKAKTPWPSQMGCGMEGRRWVLRAKAVQWWPKLAGSKVGSEDR